MVKIRVTCGGCGIEYTDGNGNARYALKTAGDGPFLCSAGQAERLVSLGVAAYVDKEEPGGAAQDKAGTDGGQDPEENQDARTGRLSAEDLWKWDYNDLRRLADDVGAKPEGRKKEDYIAAITAAEVTEGGRDEEDDAPPELGPADPE